MIDCKRRSEKKEMKADKQNERRKNDLKIEKR